MPESASARATESAIQTPADRLDQARLVSAVLQKDRKAMAEFVSRHADSVYGYVRYRLAPPPTSSTTWCRRCFWRRSGV